MTWVLEGHPEHFILTAIPEHWPDDEPGPLIAAALERLAKTATVDVEIVAGWCFEATRFVYQKMLDVGDHTGALRAIKQLLEIARKQ